MAYIPNSHVYVRVMSDPPDYFMVWHGHSEMHVIVRLGWLSAGAWETCTVPKKLFDALSPEDRKMFYGKEVDHPKTLADEFVSHLEANLES
jgi:hypothetical protein